MSNIRLTESLGSVFYNASDDTVYHMLDSQPTIGEATESPDTGDERGISGVSFDYDNTSPYLSSWSACEVGIIEYDSNYHDTINLTSADQGTYPELYTAPADGELRVWIGVPSSGRFGIYVNGIYVTHVTDNTAGDDQDSFEHAAAVRLAVGDIVTIGNNPDPNVGPYDGGTETIEVRFRPDVYPPTGS